MFDVIRRRLGKPAAAAFVASSTTARISPPADRPRFIETVEAELLALHAGNFARYQVTPAQFDAWQEAWAD